MCCLRSHPAVRRFVECTGSKQVRATQHGDDLGHLGVDDRFSMPGKSHTQDSGAGSDDIKNVSEFSFWCVSEHVSVCMSVFDSECEYCHSVKATWSTDHVVRLGRLCCTAHTVSGSAGW